MGALQTASLSCRCRYCGFVISYSADDVGCDARCPQCGQDVRLPGKLSKVATILPSRKYEPVGLACEIGGFICMFLFFPWGAIVGAALVGVGWRKSNTFRCSSCGATVKKDALRCSRCKSHFAEDR